jgi:hypothetical protein
LKEKKWKLKIETLKATKELKLLDFRLIGARSDRERENCRENSLSSWFSGFWGFILFWVFI